MFTFTKMSSTENSLSLLTPHAAVSSDNNCLSNVFEQAFQVKKSTVSQSSNNLITNDPYTSIYADNFDLSLLPQECINSGVTSNLLTATTTETQTAATATDTKPTTPLDNIPTTVFNFDKPSVRISTPSGKPSPPVPNIKIEQTWSSCPSLQAIKQEQIYQPYFPATHTTHLIPPPAYPQNIYPSPQSSPAQSEYGFPSHQFGSSCYDSLSSSRNSLYNVSASSPCPSIDAQSIKQEQLHILPPSPPDSNCDTPTPMGFGTCSSSSSSSGSIIADGAFTFKSEPFDSDAETLNDYKPNVMNGIASGVTIAQQSPTATTSTSTTNSNDHQLLREYLEDTTFQKRHNLKPLALESFIGGLEQVRGDIEPVISLAMEHAKRDVNNTCAQLQISQDPSAWSTQQVQAWLRSTLQQFKLPLIDNLDIMFPENGANLMLLTEDEFIHRIPECGSTLHAQLEIWKLTYSGDYQQQQEQHNTNSQIQHQSQQQHLENMWMYEHYSNQMEDDSEDENDCLPQMIVNTTCSNSNGGQFSNAATNDNNLAGDKNSSSTAGTTTVMTTSTTVVKRAGARNGGSHIHLWQFLKELLAAPQINGTAIRWIDRSKGIFKIEDSVRVAKLWGKRKNRPAMNYDKLSRSIRQYYKKGIMKKTERSQRLVYQFCQPYHM